MSRAYQPITPTNNKVLQQKWDKIIFDLHRHKVDSARPVIDNRPPETYLHMHLKIRKLQMEEERLAMIERDNRILLEKMSYIMRTKGSVDHLNEYVYKSLNKQFRQRELLRITHENQAILQRLLYKEPHYNHLKWHDQWLVNQRYMNNICKYPIDLSLLLPTAPPKTSNGTRTTCMSHRRSKKTPERTARSDRG